ncbi:hypothetical protein AKJ40_00690 [candidate division MSBL1 archaeon SCGC-AAA259M10]|uniref:Uncharacterized protein n=1 Tax=candidate division MSBL1 archaeon SCGC-AAA259M10 TaxID=1698270 RepID=A0A133V2R0_9EURY|nr:hypothetical protein AKJ40_00690 [candidate division MSBL1 archaeon SCGC-AAA259M10]
MGLKSAAACIPTTGLIIGAARIPSLDLNPPGARKLNVGLIIVPTCTMLAGLKSSLAHTSAVGLSSPAAHAAVELHGRGVRTFSADLSLFPIRNPPANSRCLWFRGFLSLGAGR